MAQTNWQDRLWGLANVFSPEEAEAEVVARDKQSLDLIEAVRTGAVMPGTREKDPMVSGAFDPVRKQLYQEVLRRAQERPETVSVGTTKDLRVGDLEPAGIYDPLSQDITLRIYDPFYSNSNRYTTLIPTAEPYQNSFIHELLHFLLYQLPSEIPQNTKLVANTLRPGVGQHEFIRYILGNDMVPGGWEGPTGAWQPDTQDYRRLKLFDYLDKTRTPAERDIYAEALRRIIRDPALLQQALQGLQQGAR